MGEDNHTLSAKVGTIVALLTMIGSIFVGGATFGTLKGKLSELQFRVIQIESDIDSLEYSKEVLKMQIKVLETEMNWVKNRTEK